jgi:selenocysteine-specific elongation factor
MIIGTAGHIDHGKTSLVKALTGIDTDRLKEEKERGITIELGFAHMVLPSGKEVAFIDVPGHEKFVKNMLAGVAGIDLALLVVSAEEGIMPQTKEHLDILRLLEINKLIVVVTKTDLAEPAIIELVVDDIEELLKNTGYQGAPVVKTSAATKEGLDQLVALIETIEKETGSGGNGPAYARLPIDRVFSVKGFGTVVTGTLFDGEIQAGDALEVAAKGKIARVRNIQVHHRPVKKAVKGQRVAVNIGGVEVTELARGDVLSTPGWLVPTTRLDATCKLLESSPVVLKRMTRVRFHQGTKETLARIMPLDREEIAPGDEAFIQLVLEEPSAVVREDRYIMRSYSPVTTIGGGKVLEPRAAKHGRKEKDLVNRLRMKASGDKAGVVKLFIEEKKGFCSIEEICRYMNMEKDKVEGILLSLAQKDEVVVCQPGDEQAFIDPQTITAWERNIAREISLNREMNPLEPGVNKEALRAKYWPNWSTKEFNALLGYWIKAHKYKLVDNNYVSPYGYQHALDAKWTKWIEQTGGIYTAKKWQIPDWSEVLRQAGIDEKSGSQLLQYLIRSQKLISIGGDLYLWHSLFNDLINKLAEWFEEENELTVAQFRDYLNTSRKIAVPLLEFLDAAKYTSRTGDVRTKGMRLRLKADPNS